MKKRLLALLLCALTLLSACVKSDGGETGNETAAQVYFAVGTDESGKPAISGAGSIFPESWVLPGSKAQVDELLDALLAGPKSAQLTSPFPAGVKLRSWELADGVLRVDLSEEYGGNSGVKLTIADYCIVLTLCQVKGVEAVDITVEGDALPYRGSRLMRADDVILAGSEGAPVTISASLYFPRRGGQLSREPRQVQVTENDTLASAVMAALVAGPEDPDLYLPMPEGTELLSAVVESRTCYVNLSRSFADGAPEDDREAALLLYAVVNTLCSLEQVDAVRLLVEGESPESYGGIPTRGALEKNYALAGEQPPEGTSAP